MPDGRAGGTLGGTDLPDKPSPAKRPGQTTEHYVCSLTIRRWETTNRFPKQITANQFVRIISMEAKGSGRCDTSWLRKALHTIPFNFHMSKMRKRKLNENLPQIYTLKVIICSSPTNTALSCSQSFCWQDSEFTNKTANAWLHRGDVTLGNRLMVQDDLPRWENWTDITVVKFNKAICGIPQPNK